MCAMKTKLSLKNLGLVSYPLCHPPVSGIWTTTASDTWDITKKKDGAYAQSTRPILSTWHLGLSLQKLGHMCYP